MKNACTLAMVLLVATAVASPCVGAADLASEQPIGGLKLGRLLRESIADLPIHACDLRKQFSQCRQYAVFPGNAAVRLAELSDACQSLGGVLLKDPCPDKHVLAHCREVKFRRDVVYDAVYYEGEPGQWTIEGLQEVCKHLPGQFAVSQQ